VRNVIIPAAVLSLWMCCPAAAQDVKSPQQKQAQAGDKQAPAYNPYRAVHDVEVGKFYLKRGDLEGAIARFKEALLYKDNYAEPRQLLGETYEKKGDSANAIRYYQEYLKILPNTVESKKVRERVARLQEKMKKDNSAAPNR
jgi:tetratricopeptide (TPR) repeat protein